MSKTKTRRQQIRRAQFVATIDPSAEREQARLARFEASGLNAIRRDFEADQIRATQAELQAEFGGVS